MIDVAETIKALRKMLRQADRDIGIAAALRDGDMREFAEWRRQVLTNAIALLEGIASEK